MDFIIDGKASELNICLEESAWPGVQRIAGSLAEDIRLVTGLQPRMVQHALPFAGGEIFIATWGRSTGLEALAGMDLPALSGLKSLAGKREVYLFTPVQLPGTEKPVLVIAGSDKRGTIYGMFHLSELLGVSPWVWFADVVPAKRAQLTISSEDALLSREPSVKYRGFFINDEWPSFGNWTFSHFGGFTAQMYEHVFELILRLKGNYLWPAMWTSNFSLDGPGLENARLADEMGIVMSNSHHEPCLRHSEEWDLVRGEDSPYGNAWNFDRNREGLTNYWRDGLKRNGDFENIITIGMRGERDSEILGRTATLKENIDYLKDVITTQNQLIKEEIGDEQVPRMLAVYKEVERYFYGDADTEGLRNWPGLNGVTCMLCEDNHGNMRRLPAPEERDRRGGWGMYYHFDYHGDPVSYEWVNSTHLPKVWEQMTECYESGVREIWIVNVGDLKPQELPLSFFMDLAYDFDRWGSDHPESPAQYLEDWTVRQFGEEHASEICTLLDGYTRINGTRRPEALNDRVYHPTHYGETEAMARHCARLEALAEELKAEYDGTPLSDAFVQLVYFPVCASVNLLQMQLLSGRNHALSAQGRPSANLYAQAIDECMQRDSSLQALYHNAAGGKWNGIMSSEHIGFIHWNDEEAMYPVRHQVYPSRRPRLVVAQDQGENSSCGGDWTRQTLTLDGFLTPGRESEALVLENAGSGEVHWRIRCDADWLECSAMEGCLPAFTEEEDVTTVDGLPEADNTFRLQMKLLRDKLPAGNGQTQAETMLTIEAEEPRTHVDVRILATTQAEADGFLPAGAVVQERGKDRVYAPGLVLEANTAAELSDSAVGAFRVLEGYGRCRAGLKAAPALQVYTPGIDAPSAMWRFSLAEEASYGITLIIAPSNPIDGRKSLSLGLQVDGGEILQPQFIDSTYEGGAPGCAVWARAVLNQCHRTTVDVSLTAGSHELRVYATDPGVVLERILIRRTDSPWPEGYLGPLPDWVDEP
ncbi:MAG: glycosyl hydrolase 115 family protein [Butyrivibrio sp.]|nr:glycosyl hydrolase 115 family protein [Butyrivibrio sp.]